MNDFSVLLHPTKVDPVIRVVISAPVLGVPFHQGVMQGWIPPPRKRRKTIWGKRKKTDVRRIDARRQDTKKLANSLLPPVSL